MISRLQNKLHRVGIWLVAFWAGRAAYPTYWLLTLTLLLSPSRILIQIPSIGLGTFQSDPDLYAHTSVKESVLAAFKAGYRHIDAALAYGFGSVEKEIGEAIQESGIDRNEIFLVTKL